MSHLENVSEDEINRLLGMVVDVENLFMSVHKEEDTDTKQVYFYLFKVSRPVSYQRHKHGTPFFFKYITMSNNHVIFFLQLLRKCILQMSQPVVEGSLGSPPFEKPNIEQVHVRNKNSLMLKSMMLLFLCLLCCGAASSHFTFI